MEPATRLIIQKGDLSVTMQLLMAKYCELLCAALDNTNRASSACPSDQGIMSLIGCYIDPNRNLNPNPRQIRKYTHTENTIKYYMQYTAIALTPTHHPSPYSVG